MRRLRAEDGFTLPEVLVAMVLFMLVLGSTLGSFDGFVTRSAATTKQNDAQDQARITTDRLVREVRNLASPTTANAKSIDKATPYDFVFKTTDSFKRRMRYCLGALSGGRATLWQQSQSFALSATDPGLPDTSACPAPVTGSGWATQRVAAANVVNQAPGDRPVFSYTGLESAGDTSKIIAIRSRMYLDVNPGKAPAETSIATGIYLRNQNRSPFLPDFGLVQSPAGSRTIVLNGSQARDPEGRTLDYYWYRGTGSHASLPDCLTPSTETGGGFTCLGRGLNLTYTFSTSGTQSITLKVIDAGGLSAVLTKQTPVLP